MKHKQYPYYFLLCVIIILNSCDNNSNTNLQNSDDIKLVLDEPENESIINQDDKNWVNLSKDYIRNIPNDTIRNLALKEYPEVIDSIVKSNIIEKFGKDNDYYEKFKVHKCRGWDGEKWYYTKNVFLATIVDEKKSKEWILPIMIESNNYNVSIWNEKKLLPTKNKNH